MKIKKRRIEQFLFYDYKGMEIHLEKMAMKGWQLNKITPLCWEYRRIEPQKLTYSITYFSEASEFNPYPTDNQQTFYDYCEAAGWQFVTTWAQMQIFCSEQEGPIPIETDESTKLKAIHRSMKKNFIPGIILLILLSAFQIFMQFDIIKRDIVNRLAEGTSLYIMAAFICLGLTFLIHLISYSIWYSRSKKSIMQGGACIERIQGYRNQYFITIALSFISLGFVVFALFKSSIGFIGIISTASTFLIIMLGIKVRDILKKLEVSKKVNIVISLISICLLTMIMTGGLGFLVINLDRGGWINKPDKTYTMSVYGRNDEWKVYHHTLPLIIEELQEVDYPYYSYELKVNESFLLKQTKGEQRAFYGDRDVPELRYTIVDVKIESLYEVFMNAMTGRYRKQQDLGNNERLSYQEIDGDMWKASQVFQLYYNEEPLNSYVIGWNTRIVSISFDTEPSAYQIEKAREKLGL